MPDVLLTGATGTLGTTLRQRLRAAGHTVRAASRSPPDSTDDAAGRASESPATDADEWVELDLAAGEGIADAMAGVDAVVHAASAPTGDTEAVDVRGTERLLDAAADAGVDNFVYPSIVGIDEIPYSYYEAKLAAERAIADSDLPHTILRATQFHEFLADIFGRISWLPVWPLPTRMEFQPIAVGEVADVLVDIALAEPQGRMAPLAGPEVTTLGELARTYLDATGRRRPVVRLPIPTATFGAFRDGKATRPDRAVGTERFAAWLDGADESTGSDSSTGTNSRADAT